MAMELLFENHTQLDEDIIHHIIEKDYNVLRRRNSIM